jgi:hypothetical protein
LFSAGENVISSGTAAVLAKADAWGCKSAAQQQ